MNILRFYVQLSNDRKLAESIQNKTNILTVYIRISYVNLIKVYQNFKWLKLYS